MMKSSVFLLFAAFGAAAPHAWADSVASKNKSGNQMFAQGKYQEAEKAYLEAQAESPARPELHYNLGNSLIKQKQFDPGLKSLRQSMIKANESLKANSWYNMGNAFFETGKFQEAADAFVQSLKINPSDRDAKHNLELALQRLKQAEQKSAAKDPSGKQQESKGDQRSADQRRKEQPEGKPPSEAPKPSNNNQPPQPQSAREAQDQVLSKERALQILDALKNQELVDQRKLAERSVHSKAAGKDW